MTTDAVGGVWSYTLRLAAALERYGVELTVAAMGPPASESQRADAAALRNVTLAESSFALEWMPDPWDDVSRAGDWLLGLAAGHDVIHLNGYSLAARAWDAPVLVAAHSCVLSWWRAVHGTDAPAGWSRYREAVAAGVQAASLVVAPSRAMLDALVAHYGAARAACVIHNGTDPRHDTQGPRASFVLAAGRVWDAAKNIAAVERAAARLRWPVFVAGDAGPEPPPVPAGTWRLGPLGSDELAIWMSRAAIFAHPARYEPFGLCVLEAALSGCALVLGDIPSQRELWDGAAVFVPPEDERALGDALESLTADAGRRAALSRAARERASRYGVAAMARAYHAQYRALARGVAPPHGAVRERARPRSGAAA